MQRPASHTLSLVGLWACCALPACSDLPSADSGSGGTASGTGGIDAGATGGAGGLGGAGSGGATNSGGAPSSGGSGTGGVPIVLDANITVDTATKYQTIDGFGAALPMWVGNASGMLTTDEVHKMVGLGDSELGFSILRTIIAPTSGPWAYAVGNPKEAKAYGSEVSILATPWSPPAGMKDNNSTTGGGHLKADSYDDYAAHLNGYAQYMAGQGVTIDVISVQNEPDWSTDYESCLWSGANFQTFAKNNAASIVGPKIMIAESLQYTRGLTDPTLNDAAAVGNIDLIGGHLYGAEPAGKFSAYPLAEQKGKNRWMTEWLIHDADGSGAAIWGGENQAVWDETLDEVMRSVQRAMDVNWNAYIWWWGRRYYSFIGDGDSGFGTTKGQVLKRGWAFSHFSKFVRPGDQRVASSSDGSLEGVSLSAFQGTGKVVLVLLNRSASDYADVVVDVPNQLTSAQAFVTSRTTNRTATSVTPSGHYATLASLPARSVVTVVMNY